MRESSPTVSRFAPIAIALVIGASSLSGQSDRGECNPSRQASDLHCVELYPAALGGDASGQVELGRVPSPFGVTVDAAGHHILELTAWIEGLPDPSTLGEYTAFVAWAASPVFDPVVKLAEVGNGRNALGRVSLDQYVILISAEASAEVSEREGPLILRGRSPSMLIEAHDLLARAPSATRRQPSRPGADPRWVPPPPYPGVPMLPGIMSLRPREAPLFIDTESIRALPGMQDLPPLAELPPVRPREVVELPNGGTLDLEAGWVRRELNGQSLLMLAFNEQHPGPLIRVDAESTIFVNLMNNTAFPTAVHWHGIRLDNRFDGVPGVTQDPVQPGESFRYRIHFPDAGIYWYHPHHREDVQQELGLYGNMLVDAPDSNYYSPVNREEVLMLDDLLLSDDGVVPFAAGSSNFSLMGRFGNVFLVNGEPEYELSAARGEVVRFYLTNVSNTRTFNVSFVEADGDRTVPLKVVASDVGKFEREEMARSAVLAPAERYVVEARFDDPGEYVLTNRVQGINHRLGYFQTEIRALGRVSVSTRSAAPDHGHRFDVLRENAEVVADIDRYRPLFDDPVDHELVLTLRADSLPLPVERSMAYDWVYFNPVEWTGTMPMMNWASTGREVLWVLRDPDTGLENMDVDWKFELGDVVKIRVTNDRQAFHAMQHPLHIHGQRFLVLGQDGVPNDNLVWKDTVLLPAGSTTDILLELSNPGRWMVHCHIAEHLESGMKFVFEVLGG